MLQNTGIVFQIQRFCIDDGPGLRTTVFLKGCPLKCSWCHNPEGKSKKISLAMDFVRCVHCGRCTTVCDCHQLKDNRHIYNSDNCIVCGKCIDICPVEAISYCGKNMSVQRVMDEVKSDINFYKSSGGGITLSGGEVLMQPDFAKSILIVAKSMNINTCIETSGAADWNTVYKVAEYADIILYDIKETDDINHKKNIGLSNDLILSNLAKLQEVGKKVFLRCPIIPGVNDRKGHLDQLAKLFVKYPHIQDIQILPYHKMGNGKTDRYGILTELDTFETPSDEIVMYWRNYLKEKINTEIIYKGDFL